MSTTKMIHKDHGATFAYDSGEVERLKGMGWSIAPPKVKKDEDVAPAADGADTAEAPATGEAHKRKPGRPKASE